MLTGHLTADAEKKEFDKNDIFKFIVADNSNDYMKDNEKVKVPEFFRCELSVKKNDGRLEHLSKGKLVSLNGRIKTSSYGPEDDKKYSSAVIVDSLELH